MSAASTALSRSGSADRGFRARLVAVYLVLAALNIGAWV